LGINTPSQPTILTKDHKIMYQNNLVSAERFLNLSNQIKKVRYTGEILYNVLLSDYDVMSVNNLQCETLNPNNLIAKLYTKNFSNDEKTRMILEMNDSLLNKDIKRYKYVLNNLV
jgi:CHAD domain-containing protein